MTTPDAAKVFRAHGRQLHAHLDSPTLAGGVPLWPKLSFLDIEKVDLPEDMINVFLAANQATLTGIRFSDMWLEMGDWHQPFGIMLSMKQLKTIELNVICLITARYDKETASYDYNYHIRRSLTKRRT
jgi:hypothetical protein